VVWHAYRVCGSDSALSHIATPRVLELIDYTICGVRAVGPGPVLSTSLEGWPDGATLDTPWCVACYNLAIDASPREARIRCIGPVALLALIADTLEVDGLTVSWTPPKQEPDGLIDIVFRVTGTRIAMRTAVAEIRKGLGGRGTVLIDVKRPRTKAG
jgi:hypothetical protein